MTEHLECTFHEHTTSSRCNEANLYAHHPLVAARRITRARGPSSQQPREISEQFVIVDSTVASYSGSPTERRRSESASQAPDRLDRIQP